jgi:hypothetical protein
VLAATAHGALVAVAQFEVNAVELVPAQGARGQVESRR